MASGPHSPLSIELLNPGPFQRLVLERDEFKLAIKGVTALEQDLDGHIGAAFVEELAGGMRSLGGFERRLAVAVALGIIPPRFKPIIVDLGRLRNEFAHGSIEAVSPEWKKKLLTRIDELMPESPHKETAMAALAAEHPVVVLGAALTAAKAIVATGGEIASARRAAVAADPLPAALLAEQLEKLRGQRDADEG